MTTETEGKLMKMLHKKEMIRLLNKKTGFLLVDCELFLEGYYDILVESLGAHQSVKVGPVGSIHLVSHQDPHYCISQQRVVTPDKPHWRLKFVVPDRFRK